MELDGRRHDDPWWITAIYKIGIPSAIAVYLVWVLTIQVRDRLDSIDQKINSFYSNSSVIIDQNSRTQKILQQICMNSATTNEERSRCF